MENNTTNFETRAVLAGAYRGKSASMASTLTHLAISERAHCSKRLNLADSYALSETERAARPTCPKCAAKWDKLSGKAE